MGTTRHHVDFQVQFRHRVSFTNDVFGADREELLKLLESSEGRTPRVQFWLDEAVAAGNPDLKQKIRRFLEEHRSELQSAGNIQIVPGGEAVKNDVHIVERMLKVFHAAELDRRSYVVVIGGGAVLDAVGFAAAIAHRGIRLVRLPTTTLGQADSGLGVKNSINLFEKKNWLGTFAVPWGVINDRELLSSLPDRDFRCGFSEAVKVSLLKDAAFFDDIVQHASAVRQRDPVCFDVIEKSALWHLKHITEGGDPFEMLEARPLDFGHWSAHRLESMSNFEIKHGEAVAVGVAIDSLYSSLRYGLETEEAERIVRCLFDLGLLIDHPCLGEFDRLLTGLEEFRQHLGGRLTVTMLEAPGRPIDVHEVDLTLMDKAIRAFRGMTAELHSC